jgi:hypothetical protein
MATTTPNYGWDVPTSTDYVKDGATAIETLGDDIDATLWTALGGAYPGLRLIKTQTIGSGVSTVTVNDAFSATYTNYRIVVAGGVASAASNTYVTLGATVTGYYGGLVQVSYSTGTVTGASDNNAARFTYVGNNSTTTQNLQANIGSPFLTKLTTISAEYTGLATGGAGGTYNGFLNNSTSYTAFTLTQSTGTLTGGTIYVYGYGAS